MNGNRDTFVVKIPSVHSSVVKMLCIHSSILYCSTDIFETDTGNRNKTSARNKTNDYFALNISTTEFYFCFKIESRVNLKGWDFRV